MAKIKSQNDEIKTENRRWRIKRINELSKAGNTISEIARILMISERTVSYYFIKHKIDAIDEEFEVYVTVRPKAKNRKINYDSIHYDAYYYPNGGILDAKRNFHEPKYCWCCGVNESIDICDNCIKEFPVC